jgi:NurA domain
VPDSYEGYARLPEDLLNDLLAEAEPMVSRVEGMLSPAIENRAELRRSLSDAGLIRRYEEVDARTICGVDGGFAVERTAAVDMLLSVAVGVEGLSGGTTAWDSTQYQWWSRADPHDLDNERLCRGVMIAQELAILADAPHQVRILDGSHLTLVIQLNSALSSYSDRVRGEARRVWERLGTVEALTQTCRRQDIVAMPKYDSSREITKELEAIRGESIPGDDKHLLTLLLAAGEYVVPRQVSEDGPWQALHFNARPGDEDLEASLTEAIEPLKNRELLFTYFKPDELSPAFRIELKRNVDTNYLDVLCSTIAGQITGPFVREPYPQYLADVMAKSVGLGLSALQAAVQLSLSRLGRPQLSEFLIHSYRTEGV